MAKKNGSSEVEENGDAEETSRLLPDGPERAKRSKELFKAYFAALDDHKKVMDLQAKANDAISDVVKNILEELGQKEYNVANRKMTPMKRKSGDAFTYFMRGKNEVETEAVKMD